MIFTKDVFPSLVATIGKKNIVESVEGRVGNVDLDAVDVGADPVGTALQAVADHEALAYPHPNYTPITRSINGRALTTDVVITQADIGLGSVDNTRDVDKPVSNAQQSALDVKLTTTSHPGLPDMVHQVCGSNYTEYTRDSQQRITSVIHWTSSARTQKIREYIYTRSSGIISAYVVKQYSGGVLNSTYTATITRTSSRISSIDCVLS